MENNKKKGIILWIVFLLLVFVAIIIFIVTKRNTSVFNKQIQKEGTINTKIVFDQPNLYLFNQRQILNQFPDRIKIHYPYILVLTPGDYKETSTVYSFLKGKKIKVYSNKILLDYFDGNILYSDGKTTYYNRKNLGVLCDQGLINDAGASILCITAKDKDPLDNKLISIDIHSLQTHELYSSPNLLGSIAVINRTLYVGETNIASHKTFITVGNITSEIPTQADIIYPMSNKVYFATLKASDVGRDGAYYEILKENNTIQIKLIEKGRIVL